MNFEWSGIERPRKGVPRRNSFLTIRDKLPVYNYRPNVRNRRSYSSARRQLVFHELDSRYIACTYIIYEIVTGASFTRRVLDSGENGRDFDDRVARSHAMRNPQSPMQTMLFHSGVYKFNRLFFHRIDFLSLYQWNTEETKVNAS